MGRGGSKTVLVVATALVSLGSLLATVTGASPARADDAPAAPGSSYAGVWHATGSAETCDPGNQHCTSAPTPPRTLRLTGPCDGVGVCAVELLDGFGWQPIANPSCVEPRNFFGDPGFEVFASPTFRRLQGSFSTDPVDPDRLQIRLIDIVALGGPREQVDRLTAERTSIPPGSETSTCRPPLAATQASAVAIGPHDVRVSWAASPPNGSLPEPTYVATASPGGSTCTSAIGETSCTVTGLDEGGTYTFTVVAHNGAGDAPPSAPSNAVRLVPCAADGIRWFSDVGPEQRFCADIDWLARGLARGYADGTFRPAWPTTRLALAVVLWRERLQPDGAGSHPYADQLAWFEGRGWESPSPGGPPPAGAPVSRAAAAHVLYARAGRPAVTLPPTPTFDDVPLDAPDAVAIEWLARTGVTQGYADGGFHPDAPLTRQGLAALLHRVDALTS